MMPTTNLRAGPVAALALLLIIAGQISDAHITYIEVKLPLKVSRENQQAVVRDETLRRASPN
jgi:hypothetical protein